MKTIKITDDMISRANYYQSFRNKVKDKLSKIGRCFDKFTVTDRDTFDGYIAELCVFQYLKQFTNDIVLWKRTISKDLIEKIEQNIDLNNSEYIEIENYFYDRYDIELCMTARIDVKTAATNLQPNSRWTYGIPVIQVDKDGKDLVVLAYVIYDKDPKKNKDSLPIECLIVGFMDICSIRKMKKSKENLNAGFDYQIENYETLIEDYIDIEKIFSRCCKNSQYKHI